MTAPSPDPERQAVLREALASLSVDPAGAEALARRALDSDPTAADARAVLAAALRASAKLDEAAAILEPLAAENDGWWVSHYELARLRIAQGRSRDAGASLERATALNPGLGGAWRLLGDIRLAAGDVDQAQAAYDRSLTALLPEPRLAPMAADFVEGRLDAAERGLREFLRSEPQSLAAAHLLAEVLARQGRLAPAESLLAEVVRQGPGLRLAREARALVLHRLGRHADCVAELDRLLADDPTDNRRRMIKAAALTELADYAGAAQVTASLVETFPDQPHAWLVHGHGLRTLGRTTDAAAAYQRCVALDPDLGEAYWSLANLKRHRFAPAAEAAMRAQLERADLKPDDRAHLGFALGKAAEDAGRDAEAFARYAEANRTVRRVRPYDAEALSRFVAASRSLFTPGFFAERAGWGVPDLGPIFVVGLPRSGSTLVDQILCSHPEVEGAQELMDVESTAQVVAAASATGYPGGLRDLRPADLDRLGRDYLDRTRPRRRLGRPRFTDKAPWNWRHVGLIRLMLPGARIVDVRRHPLATCVSVYKQHFGGGFDFAYDLTDLGRYYADYVALMAHFDTVSPGQVVRVIYEDLVGDTEGEVRRLLAALGLPFDPACLRFFETDRPVATPSSDQVRRPIYRDALDDWRRFDEWLDPLKAALGPVLDAWRNPAYPSSP